MRLAHENGNLVNPSLIAAIKPRNFDRFSLPFLIAESCGPCFFVRALRRDHANPRFSRAARNPALLSSMNLGVARMKGYPDMSCFNFLDSERAQIMPPAAMPAVPFPASRPSS